MPPKSTPKVKNPKNQSQHLPESVSVSQTSTRNTPRTLPSSSSGNVNQFASPQKNNTSMIAYVHQLSPPRRNKKNTMDYSTLLLQTEDTTKNALCYSKNKRPLLNDSQTSRTPINLQRFTFTEDGAKLVINDMTNLSQPLPTEYKFQFQPPAAKSYPNLTVDEIKRSSNDGDLVTFAGKLLHQADSTLIGTKNLRVADAIFADTTGTITVSLWAEFIQAVQVGKVYQIAPLQVKTWNGVKKLSSTPGSYFTEVSHQAQLNKIPLTHRMPDSNEGTTTVLTGVSINSVHSVETYFHCVNCRRRMAHATAAKFIQCQRCGAHMKTEKCQRQLCARLFVQSGEEQLQLTAFEDVLKQVFPDLVATSETGLAEMILDIDSVSVTYNSLSRIIQNFSVFEK